MSTTFPVIIEAIWTQRPDSFIDQLRNKSLEMASSNLTDGEVYITNDGQYVALRYWATPEAANDWISFVTGLNSPELISISIKS